MSKPRVNPDWEATIRTLTPRGQYPVALWDTVIVLSLLGCMSIIIGLIVAISDIQG